MKLLRYDYIKKITAYKTDENIPGSLEQKHVILEKDYIAHFLEYPEYKDLIFDEINVLKFILELYRMIKDSEAKIEEIQKQSRDCWYDDYMIPRNKEEWIIVNQIQLWKEIIEFLKKSTSFTNNDKELSKIKAIIVKYELDIEQLKKTKSDIKNNMNISYHLILGKHIGDLLNRLNSAIPTYFSCDIFFTNSGNSYFVIDPDTYCYFVGNKRGSIFNLNEKRFPKDYDDFIIEQIIGELEQLEKKIRNIQNQINNSITVNYERLKSKLKIPNNFLEIFLNKNIVELKQNQFEIKKGYKTIIISFLSKISYNMNSEVPYDLFSEVFTNRIAYKDNKSNDGKYFHDYVIPFINNYFPDYAG